MVKNFGVKLGLDIGTAICDRSIGSSQLLIGNTLGNTAKSKGLLDIREYLCLAANGDFLSFYKSGETKVLQVIKAKLRCDLTAIIFMDCAIPVRREFRPLYSLPHQLLTGRPFA